MKTRKFFIMISSVVLYLIVSNTILVAAPPIPARIGGNVTVSGTQLTQAADTGYTFKVTKQNGTAYNPVAEDTDGLNAFDWYVIDIPIYDATDQPGGAQPGEIAVIHVYLNGAELTVTSPSNGEFQVGDSGTTNQINIVAQTTQPDITVTDSIAPINDQQIPFGSVTIGSYSDQTVTVKNDGNANLIIGNIAQNNPLASPLGILNDHCSGTSVNPQQACTLTVRFSPTTTGPFSDSFDIPSNDTDEASVIINVSGTGVSTPVADITVIDSLDSATDLHMPFGSVAIGLSVVKITNNGNANLVIGAIAQNNTLASPFGIGNDNCSNHTLAPATSCTFTVSFSPTATNSFSDSFDIPSDDPDEASVTISVSGTGYFPSGNNPNPPSVFTLTSPSNGQTGLGTTITLKWEKSTDPDRNAVTYKLYYSDNPHFIGSTPIQIASVSGTSRNTYYAGAGMSMSLLLFGIVLGSGVRGKRKTILFITLIAITIVFFVSCGGGGGGGGTSSGSSGGGSSSNEVSQSVSSLNSGTTYYWKVSADDGNGGITESETRSFATQ